MKLKVFFAVGVDVIRLEAISHHTMAREANQGILGLEQIIIELIVVKDTADIVAKAPRRRERAGELGR